MTLPPVPAAIAPFLQTDDRVRAAYSEGAGIARIVPAAVALPSSEAEIAALVRWASVDGVPLVPRGAGSGMSGGNIGEGIVVDLTALNAPPDVDAASRRVTTQAGVTAQMLNDAVARFGLRMPVVPSSGRFATAGGMVSTNAAGARSVRYGSVRPWVDGLVLVTGEGEPLRLRRGVPPDSSHPGVARWRSLAPRIEAARQEVIARYPGTKKNSAGYALDGWLASGDLLDLVIGAEGTLGIVTAITWRLDDTPAERRTLQVALPSLDRLVDAVRSLLPLGPSSLELLDATFLRFVAEMGSAPAHELAGAEALLLVEFEGAGETTLDEVVREAQNLLGALTSNVRVARSDAEADTLWSIRHAASPILADLRDGRRSMQVIEDGAVPLERLAEYVRGIRALGRRHDVDLVLFGHAGDGHVHVNLLPDVTRPEWLSAVRAIFDGAADLVLALGGTPAGEHGDGRLRAPLVGRLYGEAIAGWFRHLREAFDPAGIMNPGVKDPACRGVWDTLKVGDGAVPIPSDIAAGLREIERRGGYGTRRLDLARQVPPALGAAPLPD